MLQAYNINYEMWQDTQIYVFLNIPIIPSECLLVVKCGKNIRLITI